MSPKNDPAFPLIAHDRRCDNWCCEGEHQGITKLEWFAGMALTGINMNNAPILIAEFAYSVAEAMIAESEKRK